MKPTFTNPFSLARFPFNTLTEEGFWSWLNDQELTDDQRDNMEIAYRDYVDNVVRFAWFALLSQQRDNVGIPHDKIREYLEEILESDASPDCPESFRKGERLQKDFRLWFGYNNK